MRYKKNEIQAQHFIQKFYHKLCERFFRIQNQRMQFKGQNSIRDLDKPKGCHEKFDSGHSDMDNHLFTVHLCEFFQ